jgi:hypothetical protein
MAALARLLSGDIGMGTTLAGSSLLDRRLLGVMCGTPVATLGVSGRPALPGELGPLSPTAGVIVDGAARNGISSSVAL